MSYMLIAGNEWVNGIQQEVVLSADDGNIAGEPWLCR